MRWLLTPALFPLLAGSLLFSSEPRYSTGGQRRAAAYTACASPGSKLSARGPAFCKDPTLCVSDRLHTVYALEPKSASSTLREALGSFRLGNWSGPTQEDREMTWFTFVRDPLERAVSGFFEQQSHAGRERPCKPHELYCQVGLNPLDVSDADAGNATMRARVLERFEVWVDMLEREKCANPHFAGQAAFLRLVTAKASRGVDFVGSIASLESDWQELGQLQRRFGVKWPELPTVPRRLHKSRGVLNHTTVPAELAQRLCTLYKEDYCCFQLPVPGNCHITC